jgi:hypothetical protein
MDKNKFEESKIYFHFLIFRSINLRTKKVPSMEKISKSTLFCAKTFISKKQERNIKMSLRFTLSITLIASLLALSSAIAMNQKNGIQILPGANGGGYKFCTPSSSPLSITNMTISPVPIVIGKNVAIQGQGTLGTFFFSNPVFPVKESLQRIKIRF